MNDILTYVKLNKVAEFCGGGTPSKKNEIYWNGDIPWVSPKDMKSRKITSSIDKITPESIKLSSAKLLPIGSILVVVRSGILARTIPIGRASVELTVNQDIKAICPKANQLNSFYLQYFLESKEFELLDKVTRGATVHRLSTDTLKSIDVPLPPLPEQGRIVAILDEAFEGLDVAIANTGKNLINARELFESILDQTLNRKDTSRTNTTLGESCEFFNGKAHEKSIDENGKYVVVNSKFISTEGGVIKRTNEQMFPLVANDITMVMSDVPKGKALTKCYVIEEDGKYSLNQRICCIKSDKFLTEYLYFQLNRHPYLLSFDNKGSQANLRKDDILSCPLYMPNIKEQKSILYKLASAKERARALEAIYQQKLDSLSELKQSLLAKAFSGELTAQPEQVLKEAYQ